MNAFSLKINSNNGECILFEQSAFVCQYRRTILDTVQSLGGSVINNFEVTLPNQEKLDLLLSFIESLQDDESSMTKNH